MADDDADELVVTDDMRTRKAAMDERSDAVITLPGGLGTLEELFETWTAHSLGMHAKPLVVLDPYGTYDRLRQFVDELVEAELVRPPRCPASTGPRPSRTPSPGSSRPSPGRPRRRRRQPGAPRVRALSGSSGLQARPAGLGDASGPFLSKW